MIVTSMMIIDVNPSSLQDEDIVVRFKEKLCFEKAPNMLRNSMQNVFLMFNISLFLAQHSLNCEAHSDFQTFTFHLQHIEFGTI